MRLIDSWRLAPIFLGAGIAVALAPTFDVAVIREAAMPTPDSFRSGQFRIGSQVNSASAEFSFVTFADLLPYAFRVKPFQVKGSDLNDTRWNIQVTFAEGLSAKAPEMMQALLADRFGLKVHHEEREQPVYELVVNKGGSKMEAADPGATPVPESTGLPGPFGGFGGPAGGPPPDGGRGEGGRGGPGGPGRGGPIALNGGTLRIEPSATNCGMRLAMDSVSMESLAETLTPFLDRPVLDSTGLKGNFKVAMNLPIEAMLAMMQNQMRGSGFAPGGAGGFGGGRGGDGGGRGGPGGGRGGDGGGRGGADGCDIGAAFASSGDTTSNQALFQAVQQLGLKLQPKKAPFDTIVVDHLEKQPSEN